MDTRDKRASVLGLGLAALLVLPEPGTIDQPDRQQVAFCYRGIEAANVVVGGPAYNTGTAVWLGTLPRGTAVWLGTLPTGTAQWGD